MVLQFLLKVQEFNLFIRFKTIYIEEVLNKIYYVYISNIIIMLQKSNINFEIFPLILI